MDSRSWEWKTKGFTLIELLIVVAIIAVTAAILFPVFAGVRERGRRTVCQSNLKQLALAMQQYVQDNEGQYPSVSNWAYASNSYLKNTTVFRCPDGPPDELTSTSILDPCDFSPCSASASYDLSHPVNYTYNMPRLITLRHKFPRLTSPGMHESALATPSTIWLNMDEWWIDVGAGGVYHYGRSAPTSCGETFQGSTLHSDAGDYSYIDGHVKWLTPKKAGEIDCANGPLPAPFTN